MHVIAIARKDVVQILRDRMTVVFLVLMPLFFTFFMGSMFRSGAEQDPGLSVSIAVRDATADGTDGGAVTELLAALVEGSPALRAERSTASAGELAESVRAGRVAAAIIVPEGYGAALWAGEAVPPLEVIAGAEASTASAVRAALDGVTRRLVSVVEAARLSTAEREARAPWADDVARQAWQVEALARAAEAWDSPPVTVATAEGGAEAATVSGPDGYRQSSPGMMIQFAIMGLVTTATVLNLERTSGTLRRMLTTPVARAEVIGGHLLATFFVAFVQLAILALFGAAVFGVPYAREPLATLIVIAALALFAACLGLLIGSVARDEGQVVTYSLIAMFVLTSLGGAWFPLDSTGPTFAAVAHLTPTAWAMDGLQNVIVRGQGVRSVLGPAAVLVAWAAGLAGLAAWRLRGE